VYSFHSETPEVVVILNVNGIIEAKEMGASATLLILFIVKKWKF